MIVTFTVPLQKILLKKNWYILFDEGGYLFEITFAATIILRNYVRKYTIHLLLKMIHCYTELLQFSLLK